MRSLRKYQRQSETGFSLIELLVVLALLMLAIGLLPGGLERLFANSKIDNLGQEISASLRDCALKARQVGRNLKAGLKPSNDCQLKESQSVSIEFADIAPVFNADGSSNGQTLILHTRDRQLTITIDRLTSSIEIEVDAS